MIILLSITAWIWLVLAGAFLTFISCLYALVGKVSSRRWSYLRVCVAFLLVLVFWYGVYLAAPFGIRWKS